MKQLRSDFLDPPLSLRNLIGRRFDGIVQKVFPIPSQAFLVSGGKREVKLPAGFRTAVVVNREFDSVTVRGTGVVFNLEFHNGYPIVR